MLIFLLVRLTGAKVLAFMKKEKSISANRLKKGCEPPIIFVNTTKNNDITSKRKGVQASSLQKIYTICRISHPFR